MCLCCDRCAAPMAIASSYAQVTAGAELHIDSARRDPRRRAKEDGLDDSSHSRVPSASLRTASAAGGGGSGSHSGGTLRGTASAGLGLGPGLQVLAAPVVRTGSGKPLRAWHALQVDTAEGTRARAAHARDSAAGSSARDGGPSDAGCVGTSVLRRLGHERSLVVCAKLQVEGAGLDTQVGRSYPFMLWTSRSRFVEDYCGLYCAGRLAPTRSLHLVAQRMTSMEGGQGQRVMTGAARCLGRGCRQLMPATVTGMAPHPT